MPIMLTSIIELKHFLHKNSLFGLLLLLLLSCKSDEVCEDGPPCDCEYKSQVECENSICCEWGWKTSHYSQYSGGLETHTTTITPNCNCKEDESKYVPLLEKKIIMTPDSAASSSVAGITDGGSELTLFMREDDASGTNNYAYLLSSANRHMVGLKDIGTTSVYFKLVHIDITEKTSKPIYNLTIDKSLQNSVVVLDQAQTYLFQTSTGLKGLIRIETMSNAPNQINKNTQVALTIKYYRTGQAFTPEQQGFYIKRNIETELEAPVFGTEQPGAFYNPVNNSSAVTDAPIAFVVAKGDMGYLDSELKIVSPDSRTNYSPLLVNGNITTNDASLSTSLGSEFNFENIYDERFADNLSNPANNLYVGMFGGEYLFKASNGIQGLISITDVRKITDRKWKVIFDIKYIKNQ